LAKLPGLELALGALGNRASLDAAVTGCDT